MGVFDFLSCSFGSVFGGFITSIIISGCLVILSIKTTKKGSVTPLAVICGCILFCLLFFQTTLMYAAIGSKTIAMDFISACHFQFGEEIDGVSLKRQVAQLIQDNPVISFFIDYTALEDFDWSQPIRSLRDVIGKEYNHYILRRLAWTVAYILLFGIPIIELPSLTRNYRKRSTRSYSHSTRDYDRDYY